jgi:hypothetical protein
MTTHVDEQAPVLQPVSVPLLDRICTVPNLFGSQKEQDFMGEYEVPTVMSTIAQAIFGFADLGLLITGAVLGLLTFRRKMEKVQRQFFLTAIGGTSWSRLAARDARCARYEIEAV